MNIGAISFNALITAACDKSKLLISGVTIFALATLSTLGILLDQVMYGFNAPGFVVFIVKFIGILLAIGIGVYGLLMTTIAARSDIAKSKKAKDLQAETNALFAKTLGSIFLYLVSLAVIIAGFWVIGQITRIPYIGMYVMGLLCVPFAIAAAFAAVYLIVSSKLIFPAIIESGKTSVIDTLKSLILLTIKKPQQLIINFFLTLLPGLFIAIPALITILAIYILYLVFGWYIPGVLEVFTYLLNSNTGALYFIVSISGNAILAYFLAHFVNVFIIANYAIYVDANK